MSLIARIGCSIAIALCATSITAVQDADEQARRDELMQLQGTWIVQSATRDGKERNEESGAVITIKGDQLTYMSSNHLDYRTMDFDVQDLDAKPKHICFRPDKDLRRETAVKVALAIDGTAGYQVDGDTLKLCFREAPPWPTEISDKKQVLWILQRETAAYRKEKLDKRLLGMKILHCELIAKKDDKRDDDVQFSETRYIGCKDTHHYFLEPFVKSVSFSPRIRGPFPKFTKVLHGLRIVQGPEGEMVLFHPIVLERRFGCPLDECRGGRYAVDRDTLTISCRTDGAWPKDFSDKGQVLWVLKRKAK